VQQQARAAEQPAGRPGTQTENVRKMLLGFSRDLRVVLLRLASRLQTLRYYAASKRPVSPSLARERCMCLRRWPTVWASGRSSGSWKIWLPLLEPDTYREARLLDEKRVEREAWAALRPALELQHSISATVQGRPSTSTASSRRCAASR
jgi:GTP pyrophosphokinase